MSSSTQHDDTRTAAAPRTQVDPRGPRFGAAVTTVVLAAALVLVGTTAGTVLIAWQTLVFALGALVGLHAQPYGVLFRRVIRPRLAPPAELEDAAPPRFAPPRFALPPAGYHGRMSSAAGASDADPDRLRDADDAGPGDPRGGYQDEEYRTAGPTELVDTGAEAMMGPGGAPQEGKDVEERRLESARWRAGSLPKACR